VSGSARSSASAFLVSGVGVLLLVGCGGGGVRLTPAPPLPTPADPRPAGLDFATARFHVDVPAGKVSITPLAGRSGTVGSAAVFSGTAVRFHTSVLFDQSGSLGMKVLAVSLTNRTGLDLSDPRVIFQEITNVSAFSDLRPLVQVSTFAGTGGAGGADGAALSATFSNPAGVAVDDQGAVYVAEATGNRIRKIANGLVSTLAGDGASGSQDGMGTAARFNTPNRIIWSQSHQVLFVTEYLGHRIRKVDRNGRVTTVAGTGVAGSTDGDGSLARFNFPAGIATDGTSLYVVEKGGHRVRVIEFTGTPSDNPGAYTVSTLAGNGSAGSQDGVGPAARFDQPLGIAYGDDGHLYVADYGNNTIRRVALTGEVVTIAGMIIAGVGVPGTTDGDGDVATFSLPYGILALPDTGYGVAILVSDYTGHTIRQLRLKADGTASPSKASSWMVQTLAGLGGATGAADGDGAAARFNKPKNMATDGSGNIYIADSTNHKIRRLRPTSGFFPLGIAIGSPPIEAVQLANADARIPNPAGDHLPFINYTGSLLAGATSATADWWFIVPSGVTAFEFAVTIEATPQGLLPPEAVDGGSTGGVGSPRVMVRTVAGSVTGGTGFTDGRATDASFYYVYGLAVHESLLFVADSFDHAIRRVEPDGDVTTVAGVIGKGAGFVDGLGNVAKFRYPYGVAVAPGSLYSSGSGGGSTDPLYIFVADRENHRVRLIRTPPSSWTEGDAQEPRNAAFYEVSTIAGTGSGGYTPSDYGTATQLNDPRGIAIGPGGTVYVTEWLGNRVRSLHYAGGDPTQAANWYVRLLAGSTGVASGHVDASGDVARFNRPLGIGTDRAGNVYVADYENHVIRKISPEGLVTTLAGSTPATSGYVDGLGPIAEFYNPRSVAVDAAGYVYVSDRNNHRIRRISPGGDVMTVAGTGAAGHVDGTGDVAQFEYPAGIAVTAGGDLYVSDGFGQERIRLIERVIDIGQAGQ
jgi:sugar lactone lactonase YvrE